jgi:integral membrane protein
MKFDLTNPIDRVRAVGLADGISFLILLGIAMPLRKFADMPMAVTWVGRIHGGLVILFILVILLAWLDKALSLRHAILAFVASLIPFGPFFFDRYLVSDKNKA